MPKIYRRKDGIYESYPEEIIVCKIKKSNRARVCEWLAMKGAEIDGSARQSMFWDGFLHSLVFCDGMAVVLGTDMKFIEVELLFMLEQRYDFAREWKEVDYA